MKAPSSLRPPPAVSAAAFVVALVAALALPPAAAASDPDTGTGIVFGQTHIALKATAGEKETVVHYPFTNKGGEPVEILRMKSGCTCTVPELKKKVYAPGESGQVEVRFLHKSFQGTQRNQVLVYTSGTAKPVHRLNLEVEIPRLLTIRPRLLYWRDANKTEPKTISIAVDYDKPIKIKSVKGSNPSFTIQLREVKPGKAYEIIATPTSGLATQRDRLVIETDLPEGVAQPFYAYLRVK